MKMRPNSVAVLVSGISLLLAATTAQAGNTFFSINFGYSNHSPYVSPYRYIYTPAYYYSIPSPFFFGYTSYYYPAFPYYYTPVVYYRPVFLYYYPYAYQPDWFYYNQYYAYRGIYPNSYIYGYYPYNQYYSHYPHKHYRYQPDHHSDHFYGHRNKQQYAGPYKKYSPENKLGMQQRSGNHNSKTAAVIATNNQQQSIRELEDRRAMLQQRPVNQRTERSGVRPSRREQHTLAATDTRPVLQRRQDSQDMGRVNNRNQRTEQSRQSEHNANNERIDRLINRDGNTAQSEMEMNDRSIQQKQIINQQSDRRAQAQVNTLNKRVTVSPPQARQNRQQSHPGNMERPGNSSFRQQPAVAERSNQNNQRQVTRQQPVRNNTERPGNRNAFRQEQVVSERNRQDNQQSRPVARKKESSTETISMRDEEQRSLRQKNGPGMQQRQMSQRSFGGAGFRH